MSGRSSRATSGSARAVLIVLVALMFLVLAFCCILYLLVSNWLDGDEPQQQEVSQPYLTVAYSPEIEPAFVDLVDAFNNQALETPDGQVMVVDTVKLDPESMVNAVLDGDPGFQAMTPDSSIWLGQLDEAWARQTGSEDASAVGETVRYAVSPVVIAMWEDLAREMGWPGKAIGWQDLLGRAQSDPDFRWSHPSTASASGLLATLAEFYAGAGKTRGLTIDDVQSQSTLDYVAELEKTVRYYGEGNEPAIIQRALDEGRAFLDAFVVQEQMVVHFNQVSQGTDRLVALYPVEGALWEDHPLAILETESLSPYQRQVFAALRDYLMSSEAQTRILAGGYRPADYNIALDAPESPLSTENGVDPSEPKTALQIPNASVIEVVRDAWWYTKRHTNVYLVVDTSGSMEGDKLEQAQEALRVFLDEIKGDEERVGLIEFASGVQTVVQLDELSHSRTALEASVDRMYADGDTALLDAVYEAHQLLKDRGDGERINAIVVMTDGRENNSYIGLRSLARELSSDSGVPVVVFSIAYGNDADIGTLRAISDPTGGVVLEGNLETIRDLYKLLSTYF